MLALLLLAASSCAAAAPSPHAAALAKLAADYWDATLAIDPISATYAGDARGSDRLPDPGHFGEEKVLDRLRARLGRVDRRALDAAGRVTWDSLAHELDTSREALRLKLHEWEIVPFKDPPVQFGEVIAERQRMSDAADADALERRLRAFPAYLDGYKRALRRGASSGRVAARPVVERALRQLDGLLAEPDEKLPYLKPYERLPEPLRAAAKEKGLAATREAVRPAVTAYRDFLRDELLPRARTEALGVGALPGGAALYRHKIRLFTTTDRSAEELHALGLSELKAVRAAVAASAAKLGLPVDPRAAFDAVRADRRNFFTSREEVFAAASATVAGAQARLEGVFAAPPRTPLVVRAVEEYREAGASSGSYDSPPDDLSSPGIFWINTGATTRDRYGLASLVFHESVPGHHLQSAAALENRTLPVFQRNAWNAAYGEGWALYAESLADELGWYPNELSRLGWLSNRAWRAARLVVDTGLHASGWTRERAVEFLAQETALAPAKVASEVDRYLARPGQALAYTVGEVEIRALREESRRREGERFDLRRFHDRVLSCGPVPLNALRAWVLEP